MEDFADTPKPPYVAVIFTSRRTEGDEGYAAMADEMDRMSRTQPGYLGIESAREQQTRLGVTVSYWATEAHAKAWKAVAEHAAAQRLGRALWYSDYRVRIATVAREYGPM